MIFQLLFQKLKLWFMDGSIEEYIGDSFKVFRDEELVEVVVDFDKSIKQLIREKVWHSSQEIRDNSDGSILVTFKVAGIREIKHWLLGFGAKARVLEPPSLREEITEEARALLDQYKPTPKSAPWRRPPSGARNLRGFNTSSS